MDIESVINKDGTSNINYSNKHNFVNIIDDDNLDEKVFDNDDYADETGNYSYLKRESIRNTIKKILLEKEIIKIDELEELYPEIGVEKLVENTKKFIRLINSFESDEIKDSVLSYLNEELS